MAPMITLYILGGCVALAALLFVIMIVLSAVRPPKLPDVSSFELPPPTPMQRVMRALTPAPVAAPVQMPVAAMHVLPGVHAVPTQVMRPPAHAVPTMRIAQPAPIQSNAGAAWVAPHIAPPPPPSPLVQAGAMVAQSMSRPVARGTAPPPIPQAAAMIAPAYPHVRIPPAPPAPPQRAQRVEPPPPLVTPAPIQWAPQPVVTSLPKIARSRPSRPTFPKRKRRKLLWFTVTLFVLGLGATGAAIAYPPLLDPLCDDYEWFGAETMQVLREYAIGTHDAIEEFIRRP